MVELHCVDDEEGQGQEEKEDADEEEEAPGRDVEITGTREDDGKEAQHLKRNRTEENFQVFHLAVCSHKFGYFEDTIYGQNVSLDFVHDGHRRGRGPVRGVVGGGWVGHRRHVTLVRRRHCGWRVVVRRVIRVRHVYLLKAHDINP